jgi:acyl carrier protein
MEERIKRVFAAVFDLPPESISSSLSRDAFSSWDSMKHLTLVIALENEFGIRFEDDEAPALESYSAIVTAVSRKLSGATAR